MDRTADGDLIAATPADLSAFRLARPTSLDEAVAALSEAEGPVSVYAGGTDFFARVREGERPATLVSLGRVQGLDGIVATPAKLTLGALVTHVAAAAHPALAAVPGLAAAWRQIATVRIRRQATLGGNLMARRTRYELSILFDALGASARMVGPEGERELPVSALWEADLTAFPLLASVSIPLDGEPRLDYERSMRPTFTQAACLRRTDAGESLRFVIATEYLRPRASTATVPADPVRILADLPETFTDPAVGNAYLRRAGAALLARQIARLTEKRP